MMISFSNVDYRLGAAGLRGLSQASAPLTFSFRHEQHENEMGMTVRGFVTWNLSFKSYFRLETCLGVTH